MNEDKIKFMIVEDDADFIYLIKQLLNNEPDFYFSGCATNKEEAIKLALEVSPDIVLMDLNLTSTNLDGIEASRVIRCQTNAKVIILTSFEDQKTVIDACKSSFASGYVLKSQYNHLAEQMRALSSGHTPQEFLINSLMLESLSPAEKSILKIMVGKGVNTISSEKTIANQKTKIFKKLGLKNQKEVAHIFRNII